MSQSRTAAASKADALSSRRDTGLVEMLSAIEFKSVVTPGFYILIIGGKSAAGNRTRRPAGELLHRENHKIESCEQQKSSKQGGRRPH